ncbi:hypothetical protein [Aliterella atlantica]|uniref:Uncharacterized protein n=1 Tax=Aliterella atlantica CENA595 TaxID=1618023 RepID=A0A0D8ZSL0_9CYAN|nr:hypothetical protein UH38_13800 [Aliterella atlantica CENA595]
MCFICHYDWDLSSLRSIAAKTLAASGGGRNQIVKVDSIVIEANRTVPLWERLLTRQIDNPRLEIQPGVNTNLM